MLVLGSADTIGFKADAASVVNVTVTGEEVSSSNVGTYKNLWQGQAPAAATTEYTAPTGGAALISHILAYNTDTVTRTLTTYVKGTAASNAVGAVAIPAGGMATFDRDGWKVFTPAILPPSLQVYLNAGQSLTGAGFNRINFDTVVEDTASGWSAANHNYVVPVAGRYLVVVRTSLLSNSRLIVSVFQNGSEVRRGVDVSGSSAILGGQVVTEVTCAVNDTLDGRAYPGATETCDAGASLTYMNIIKVRD